MSQFMASLAGQAPLLMGLSLLVPGTAWILVGLAGKWPNLREGISTVATLLTFAFVVPLVSTVTSGARPGFELFEVMPGVSLAFELEPLGMLYALVASGLWILTSLYAIGYMRGHDEDNQTRFFMCFPVAIFAALGIAYSKNLFTLFFFYEVLTLSTYPLVTHYGEQSKKAGRVYLSVLIFTSVAFLLLAILWTYSATGTGDFKLGGFLKGKLDPALVPILLGLFAFGTGKAALMPFHRWLPNAMVAPTPVSALLHAVAVVKAGVFTVTKVVVYVFGIEFLTETGASVWLMYVAAGTMLIAAMRAITLDNLKARLAYSTISQLAYIVLAAMIATPAAILGGGMHIAMHAVGKITLFFCAGAIYVAAHKKNISDMKGLARTMPWTTTAFFIGALSIIGIPPLGGAWPKWFMGLGAMQADQMIFTGAYMLASLLGIAYLMPVCWTFWSKPPLAPSGEEPHGHEAPLLCVAPLVITAAGCVALFVFAQDIHALLLPIVGGGK